MREIFDRIKAEDTSEPMWSGVTQVEDSGTGVTVHFEPAGPPPLRRAGGVEVACVLYPEQDTDEQDPAQQDTAEPDPAQQDPASS